MEGSGSNIGVERVGTEQVIEGEATRNILEKQLIRWAKRGDTSPSVLNVERLQFRNTGAVIVVAFDDGKPGQKIDVLGDGQTTVNHNSKILRASGASGLLANNAVYTFTMWEDRVWHESSASAGGGGGGGVTSFNTRVGAVVPAAGDYPPAFIGAVPASHLTDPDPHTQYVLDSEKGAAGGVAQLDGTTHVPPVQLGSGSSISTKFLRGDGTWQPIAGGAGTYDVYDPGKPSAAPDAKDDDFNVSPLDVKWTLVNFGGGRASQDVNVSMPLHLLINRLLGTAPYASGIVQALPAGDFTVFTRVYAAIEANFQDVGIILSDDNTGAAGNQLFGSVGSSGNVLVQAVKLTSWNANAGAPYQRTLGALGGALATYMGMFVRMRRVAANYFVAFSHNGITWTESAAITMGTVMTYVGLFAGSTVAGIPLAFFDFFRFYAGNGAVTRPGGVRTIALG